MFGLSPSSAVYITWESSLDRTAPPNPTANLFIKLRRLNLLLIKKLLICLYVFSNFKHRAYRVFLSPPCGQSLCFHILYRFSHSVKIYMTGYSSQLYYQKGRLILFQHQYSIERHLYQRIY